MSIIADNKLRPLFEIGLVALVFFAIRELASSVPYPSQIAEVVCLILITILLKRRGSGWKELGFRLPDNWLKAIGYTVLCVITIGVVFNFIIAPLFPHGANEINAGKETSFNQMLFQLIVIGIGTAAIGEELLFRGFVLNKLNDLFGRNALGTAGAVVIQAVMFALLHSGTQGMVSAGVIGLILGVFYLFSVAIANVQRQEEEIFRLSGVQVPQPSAESCQPNPRSAQPGTDACADTIRFLRHWFS